MHASLTSLDNVKLFSKGIRHIYPLISNIWGFLLSSTVDMSGLNMLANILDIKWYFSLFLITSEVGHICTNLLIIGFSSSVKWVSMLFAHIFINLHVVVFYWIHKLIYILVHIYIHKVIYYFVLTNMCQKLEHINFPSYPTLADVFLSFHTFKMVSFINKFLC